MCTKTKLMLGVSAGIVGILTAGALLSLGLRATRATTAAQQRTETEQDKIARERMVGEGGHEGYFPA